LVDIAANNSFQGIGSLCLVERGELAVSAIMKAAPRCR
jgi:hypothetical protein